MTDVTDMGDAFDKPEIVKDDELSSNYETIEGDEPHPEARHEARTIVRSRNDGLVQMMTEIDDGVFVAWMKCDGCNKSVQDCGCKTGPKMPAYIERWRDDRFEKSLRWGTKLVKVGEEKRRAWVRVDVRGGIAETSHSDNVTLLQIDWDNLGDDWNEAEGILDQLDSIEMRLPSEMVQDIRESIAMIWPDEVAERAGETVEDEVIDLGFGDDDEPAEGSVAEETTEATETTTHRVLGDNERNIDVGF